MQLVVGQQGIAIDGSRGEAVIQAQLLQLPVGGQQRLAIPKPDICNRAPGLLEVGCGDFLARFKNLALHGVQAKGLTGGGDAALDVGGFHLQLPRLHHQPLNQGGDKPFRNGQQGRCRGKGQQNAATQPALGQGDEQA